MPCRRTGHRILQHERMACIQSFTEESEIGRYRTAYHVLPDRYLRPDCRYRGRDWSLPASSLWKRVMETTEISVITDEIDPNKESDIAVHEENPMIPKGIEVYEINGTLFLRYRYQV